MRGGRMSDLTRNGVEKEHVVQPAVSVGVEETDTLLEEASSQIQPYDYLPLIHMQDPETTPQKGPKAKAMPQALL